LRVSQQRDRGALLSRNHALERRSGVVPSDQEVRLFPVSGTLGDWGVHWLDQVLWWTEEKYPKRVFSSAGRPVAGPVIVNEQEQTTDAPDHQVATFEFEKFTCLWEHRRFAGNEAERHKIRPRLLRRFSVLARRDGGASPEAGCDRGAPKPEPKSDATLRATVLFGPDAVAHSLQTPEGYARCSRLVWAKNPSSQTWSYL